MIRTVPMVEEATRFMITIRFLLEDDSGSGIQKFTVIDNYGTELIAAQPENCPVRYEFVHGPINRSRLPVMIETIDCNDLITPEEVTGPIFGSGRRASPGFPLPCTAVECADNPACAEANEEVGIIRLNYQRDCDSCQSLRDLIRRAEEAIAFFGALFAFFVTMAAILAAFPFGAFAASVCAFFAVLFLYWLVRSIHDLIRHKENQARCESSLLERREVMQEAIDRLNAECCPGCITVDLTTPC